MDGPVPGRLRRTLPALIAAALVVAAVTAADPVDDTPVAQRTGADGQAASRAEPGPTGPGERAPAVTIGEGTASTGRAAPGPGRAPAPGASPIGTGTSVFGVDCATGSRQLPTSAYGAACQRTSDGTNPGATARGVTANTITITMRTSTSGQSATLVATAGTAVDSIGANQAGVASDMQRLVDHLNRVYDLYGRRVVLRVFNGQGDYLAENQNQSIQGAQSDAARARDLGAFADVSVLTMSQPYSEALVSQQIIAMGPLYMSEDWYLDRVPFAYGAVTPIGSQMAEFMGNAACRRLAGGTAVAATDADLHTERRVFGIIHAENPEYALMGQIVDRALRACGHAPARRVSYALNVATLQSQQTNAIAQLKAAGATTVICLCDVFTPIFLTRAADQQHYGPEWLHSWWPDPWQRLTSSARWRSSLHSGGASPDFLAGEVGTTFRAASGGAPPQAPTALHHVHQQLVALFSALQAAGPDLTPDTFRRGWESLPSTTDGAFGPWTFGPGIYNPKRHFQLGRYDPAARSRFDGLVGAILSCEGGRWYRFDDAAALGSGPLDCYRS